MAAASDGLSGYHIREIGPDGTLPASRERDQYFPKFYSTEARTPRVYGLDLIGFGSCASTVEHIRDENLLSTSPPVMLHIGEGDRPGFWAGVPVYARGTAHETLEDRQRNVLGIIQGVFQIGVLVDAHSPTQKRQYASIFSRPRRPPMVALSISGRASPPHQELAGKIIDNRSEARRLAQSMRHVEAVLKLLDPEYSLRRISIRRRA